MDWYVAEDEVVWEDVEEIKLTFDYGWMRTIRYNVKYRADSKTGRKLLSISASDAATSSCKEPGPSWARRLYCDRPARRAAKRELQKYIQYDGEYEPMILAMEPLPYWT